MVLPHIKSSYRIFYRTCLQMPNKYSNSISAINVPHFSLFRTPAIYAYAVVQQARVYERINRLKERRDVST